MQPTHLHFDIGLPETRRFWHRSAGLLMLHATAALTAPAQSAKVPATVNIGVGPTVGTVWMPSLDAGPGWSVGIALRAEGHVSKKTLHSKKVMRKVPRRYKGIVRGMDDLHVAPLPTMLIPDQTFIGPLNANTAGQSIRGAGWTPVSMYLVHESKPTHRILAVSPRVGWVQHTLGDPSTAEATHHAYLGLDLNPELESSMRQTVGVAVGGNVGPGVVFRGPDNADRAPTLGIWTDLYVRMQVRTPIKVSL